MVIMPTTYYLLCKFGLYPSKNISKTGVKDTLQITLLSLPILFNLITSFAYFVVNFKTADIAIITDSLYTNFVFLMMCGNYYLLALRKFTIREVIDDFDAVINERKSYFLKHQN